MMQITDTRSSTTALAYRQAAIAHMEYFMSRDVGLFILMNLYGPGVIRILDEDDEEAQEDELDDEEEDLDQSLKILEQHVA